MAAGGSAKVIVFAFLANLGIAIAKLVGALVTQSASLLAEAIHSLVDSTNQLLLLLGGRLSKKPPTARYPLGFGRETFFWSFIVAILLFSMGGLFAIYEGYHKLHEPHALSHPWVALGILLVSTILEGFSFYACYQEVRAQNPNGSLWKWFRKTTASELLVVFTEDLAAMAGLLIATIALIIAWQTGDSRWDGIGSMVVGVVLVATAILLAIEIKALLIGEAPSFDLRPIAEEEMKKQFPQGKLLHLIALQTGSSEVMLSLKFDPVENSDVPTLIHKMNLFEKNMKARCPELRWQFIEPDRET